MRLILLHPGVARRACETCVRYLHHEHGPQAGEVVTRGGKPVPRTPGSRPPCNSCPKIPPGADPRPENAAELVGRAADAYRHYLECRAVSQFPDDPIVRHTAVMVRAAEDAAQRADSRRLALTVLGRSFGGGG